MADPIARSLSKPKTTCDRDDDPLVCGSPPATPKAKSKDADAPLVCTSQDRSMLPGSTVSYAELAKNAQSKPACDSIHPEACQSDEGWRAGGVTRLDHKGSRGAETSVATTEDGTKLGTVRGQIGTQNEVGVTVASKQGEIDMGGGAKLKLQGKVGDAGAAAGFHNPDGSTGVNANLGASAASAGAVVELADGSAIGVGVEAGVSAGGSFGLKTGPDGKALACLQVSLGPFQINACSPTAIPGNVR